MKKYLGYIITVIISIAIGVGTTVLVLDNRSDEQAKKVETIEKTVQEVSIMEQDTLETAIKKVYDSVVVIEGYERNYLASSGSGFVYKTDDKYGYILTNNHVVEDCSSIMVVNTEGVETEATVLGRDVYSDLAVLRIDKGAVLSVATLGKSADSAIGDTVFTVGAPNGREYIGTVTKGIISGLNREVTVSLSNGSYIMEVIQTDAAINPGNSGGPLVNINGEVIGINSLKLVEDEIEGMGFAIPIEEVQIYLERLEKGETIKRPTIGLEMIDIGSSYQQAYFQINVDQSIKQGAVVVSVVPNSPAAAGGLKKGDVIISVNGVEVNDVTHFRYLLHRNEIGDTIKLVYNRNGEDKLVEIKLTQ